MLIELVINLLYNKSTTNRSNGIGRKATLTYSVDITWFVIWLWYLITTYVVIIVFYISYCAIPWLFINWIIVSFQQFVAASFDCFRNRLIVANNRLKSINCYAALTSANLHYIIKELAPSLLHKPIVVPFPGFLTAWRALRQVHENTGHSAGFPDHLHSRDSLVTATTWGDRTRRGVQYLIRAP